MTEQQKVLERAWQLQEQAEQAQEAQVRDRALRDAASELGLDPAYLEQAREELAREEARRLAERRRQVRRLGVGVAALAGALGLGLAGWLMLRPPAPQLEDFTGGQARWSLDANPGTDAHVRWEQDAGHGEVAVIDVDHFALDGEGKYRANLNQVSERDLEGYRTLTFAVRGEGLPVVRVYLEAPGERWRSPPVPVTGTWAVHTLPLSSFERQVQENGWKVVRWEAPERVQTISFKVGHYMNGPDASGEVRLDDLRLE